MRILHTADLHLGRQFNGLSLEADHDAVLSQIVEVLIDERADVLVIAGDVFDRASPPTSAINQFNRFVTRVSTETTAAIVMISGNHDSGDRIEAMSIFAKESYLVRGVAKASELPLVLQGAHGAVAFTALPFCYEYAAQGLFGDQAIRTPEDVIRSQIAAARQHLPKDARWVVVAHAFVAGGAVGETEKNLTSVGGIETVPADVFEGADYVALGHLHRPQHVGSAHIRYSGAPLAFGFDEIGQEKSMSIVDIGPTNIEVRTVPFRPLRNVRSVMGAFSELVVGEQTEDFVKVVLTDENPVIDAMKRLREVYPNACHLSYAKDARAPETKAMGASRAPKTPLEMIGDFLTEVRGQEIRDDESIIIAATLDALAKKESQE